MKKTIPALILMLALSPAYGLAPKPRPLVDICKDHFERSSAYQSCTDIQYADVGGGYCKVMAWCRSVNETLSSTSKRTKPSEADELYNCQGQLTIKVC